MTSKKEQLSEDDTLIKRNNQAPGFPASVVRSRLQLLIERFIQFADYDLKEYIQAQRILKFDIDIPALKDLYPGPNWKKDIDKAIKFFMRIEGKADADGNFDYTSLFSRAKLDNIGLHLNIDPEVLQLYIIRAGIPNTELDYNLTKKIKCAYTYDFYWEMCKHDYPSSEYSFFLSPEDINAKFKTKYQSSNITDQIISPVEKEIKEFYDNGLSPRFFTVNEKREVIGKCKKIVGWEFIIHNESRTKRQDIAAQEAFRKIDIFLRNNLSDKLRINTLEQIRLMPSDKVIQIKLRLEKFENSDTSHIHTKTGYLCFILQAYGINPRSRKVDRSKIKDAPLFEKEEKDTTAGIGYWYECLQHIKESAASEDIKSIFAQLRFEEYRETETKSILVFNTSKSVVETIETYFINDFKRVLLKYFPSNLNIYYNAR